MAKINTFSGFLMCKDVQLQFLKNYSSGQTKHMYGIEQN